MSFLWNILSMKYPVYELSCLWNILSSVYKITCLWNILSMKWWPVYDEMSCLRNVLSMKCLFKECTIFKMSCLCPIPVLRLGWLLPISTFPWDLAPFYQSYPGTVSKQIVGSQPKPEILIFECGLTLIGVNYYYTSLCLCVS